MNRRRSLRLGRRAFWILGVSLLVLAGSGLYAYFIGTRSLLEHAEAFAFRRMTVSRLADLGSFRFFYVTNRREDPEAAAMDERYAAERRPGLAFGSFDTRIEASLGLGMLINPSDWFLNEEIQLQDVRPLGREEFVQQLRHQVRSSPAESLLVVVHGFREAFPSALRKTAFLAHVLDIDTPVLLFDWPGNQGSSLRGYRRARQVARDSGTEFAATLELILRDIEPQRLWLLANSMGGQVVTDAFQRLAGDGRPLPPENLIEHVVLTAPDVDQESFNARFKHDIKALARNLTVYVSSNDRALLVSRVINRGMRLGESTLNLRNPSQIEEVARLTDLVEPGDTRLALVDVTPVNRTRNFHNFSLETPEFFDDLFLRLTGTRQPPRTRELYHVLTPDGAQYSVLTRGR